MLAAQAAPASSGTTAEDRSQTFRPVQGGGEMQSGERLLVEAYAAIWLIVFALVLLSWRRQRRIDARIDALDASLQRARKRDGEGA
ncbi:MAG: CcmD family protein [Polyangiaceae bacterium]|nr:CcmD family protein [Polyangiaceae bacterium]